MFSSNIADDEPFCVSEDNASSMSLSAMAGQDVSAVAELSEIVRKGRSRKGSKKPRCDDNDGAEEQTVNKKARNVITFDMKANALVFMKACDLCHNKDSDPDPCDAKVNRLWGEYKLRNDVLSVDGTTCWYCLRVWQGKYLSDF